MGHYTAGIKTNKCLKTVTKKAIVTAIAADSRASTYIYFIYIKCRIAAEYVHVYV